MKICEIAPSGVSRVLRKGLPDLGGGGNKTGCSVAENFFKIGVSIAIFNNLEIPIRLFTDKEKYVYGIF